MDIINIPVKPDHFLNIPMKSHISLFYERINFPFDTSVLRAKTAIILKVANIQFTYTNDLLERIFIYFTFKDRFVFKFNSIVIDGDTSYNDLKRILLNDRIEYSENYFSENQLNVCVNNWATFFFDIESESILLQKIQFPLNPDLPKFS